MSFLVVSPNTPVQLWANHKSPSLLSEHAAFVVPSGKQPPKARVPVGIPVHQSRDGGPCLIMCSPSRPAFQQFRGDTIIDSCVQ